MLENQWENHEATFSCEKITSSSIRFWRVHVRALSLYSMFDGSRQGFLGDVGGNKSKKKICLLAHVGKIKIISTYCAYFLTELLPIWFKKIPPFGIVGGKNKKKTQKSVFFSCRGQFYLVGGLVEHRI